MSNAYDTGRIIAGRYRIASLLSQGGMGAVYLAQQVSLGRDVALKIILRDSDDAELLARFDVEARAVCQLRHPNIITYHDYGRDEAGNPFLVMEFLAGFPGTKLVGAARKRSVAEIVHVVVQVCSALHEAHKKGIVHRDLKWSNVMIVPQAEDPLFAKLIDFGIVKVGKDGAGDLRQRTLTGTGMLLGTPDYMSPEVITGMAVDGRADEYALAIMLFEALEGARPFKAATMFELFLMQVKELPPPFVEAAPIMEQYPLLEGVIRRALEKHPDDRYPDIAAFRGALLEAVRDEGVGGRPGSGAAPVRGRSEATRAAQRESGARATVAHAAPGTNSRRPGESQAAQEWNSLAKSAERLPATNSRSSRANAARVAVTEPPAAVAAVPLPEAATTRPVRARRWWLAGAAGEAGVEVEREVEVEVEVDVDVEVEVEVEAEVGVHPSDAAPEVTPADEAAGAHSARDAGATLVASPSKHSQLLTVQAEPWAEVTVNGKPLGTSPKSLEVPLGKAVVICDNPQTSRQVLTVRITADGPALARCIMKAKPSP